MHLQLASFGGDVHGQVQTSSGGDPEDGSVRVFILVGDLDPAKGGQGTSAAHEHRPSPNGEVETCGEMHPTMDA